MLKSSAALSQTRVLTRVRQAVCHVEEFSCSLMDYFERTKGQMFSWNIVWLGVAVAKLRLSSRGIHLLQGRSPEKKEKETAQVHQLFTFNLKQNCTLAKSSQLSVG